jgi:hypothetical protein
MGSRKSTSFLGGDWRITPIFSVNLGMGFDLIPRGPGIVFKSCFEWDWHRS